VLVYKTKWFVCCRFQIYVLETIGPDSWNKNEKKS